MGKEIMKRLLTRGKSALKLKSDLKAAQDLTSEIESSILALRKKRLNDAGVDAVHRWANKVMPKY